MPADNNNALRAMAVAIQTPGLSITVEGKKKRMLGLPILLWGPPGVAKTAFVQQLADKLGFYLITVLASLREPSDFLGLPIPGTSRRAAEKAGLPPGVDQQIVGDMLDADYMQGGKEFGTNLEVRRAEFDQVQYAPPDWALKCLEMADDPDAKNVGKGRRVLLFLDEFATASPQVQAALLRVVHERVVGDLQLPSNVAVIAAANPPSMSPGGSDLTAPTVNRFIHLDWMPPSKKQWADFVTGKRSSSLQLPIFGDTSGAVSKSLNDALNTFDDAERARRLAAVQAQRRRAGTIGLVEFNSAYQTRGDGSISALAAKFILDTKNATPASLTRAAKASGEGPATYAEYKEFEPLFAMPTKKVFDRLQKAEPFQAQNLAWASPRSWEIALRAVAGATTCGLTPGIFEQVTETLLCGTIGPAYCDAFTKFIKKEYKRGLRTPESILAAGPAKFVAALPKSSDATVYDADIAYASSLASYGLNSAMGASDGLGRLPEVLDFLNEIMVREKGQAGLPYDRVVKQLESELREFKDNNPLPPQASSKVNSWLLEREQESDQAMRRLGLDLGNYEF